MSSAMQGRTQFESYTRISRIGSASAASNRNKVPRFTEDQEDAS